MTNISALADQSRTTEGGWVDDPRLATGAFRPASGDNKPRWLPKKHGETLNQFVDPVFSRLSAMDDGELWAVVDASLAVSQINCSWQQYGMAKLIYDSAAWELRDRLTAQGMSARQGENSRSEVDGEARQPGPPEADAPCPHCDTAGRCTYVCGYTPHP